MKFQVLILYILTFLDLFAVGMIVPLVSGRVTSLGGSHFMVGLMGSFYSGLQLFSGPYFGSLSDIKGRKPVLLMTLVACAFFYMQFGIITSIYYLLVLRIFIGIFKHTQTLAKAFVADLVTDHDEQADVYGKMSSISGVGMTIGPMFGGHLIEDFPPYGFGIACAITSFVFILNAALIYFYIPSPKVDSKKKENIAKKSFFTELKEVDWAKYWDVFLLKALSSFSMAVFFSNYSPLLKHSYALSPKWIGYTISFQSFVGSICSFFIQHMNDAFYKRDHEYLERNFHSFLVLTFSFCCVLISSNWYIFCLMLMPMALGNVVLRLIGLEIIVQRSPPDQRGCLIGASNSIRSVSGILGPTIAGILGDTIGVERVLIVSLISATVGLIVTFYYKSKGSIPVKEKIK